jgi:hypothetical protein
MLRISDIHTTFIGKICKLTSIGVEIEKEYEKLFGIGNYFTAERLFYYCHSNNENKLILIFIDEKPITKHGLTWFCLKEIGNNSANDYYWFTLDQIVICN